MLIFTIKYMKDTLKSVKIHNSILNLRTKKVGSSLKLKFNYLR